MFRSFTRSSGYSSICILLLLPFACCDCWGNDAWHEISFHNNPSHEVMNNVLLFILQYLVYFVVFVSWWLLVTWHLGWIDSYRWGATLMNSFLFNVGLILLCSIRLASWILDTSHSHVEVGTILLVRGSRGNSYKIWNWEFKLHFSCTSSFFLSFDR